MRVIITTTGTAGDIVPFLEIGSELLRRGNDVQLITHCHYQPAAQELGLRFEALDTPEQFCAFVRDGPLLETPSGLLQFGDKHVFSRIRYDFNLLERHCREAGTVIVARHMSLAASLVSERCRVPLVTVFPAVAHANGFGLWVEFCRSMLAKRINRIREELGLPAIADWRAWSMLPAAFLACWPDWFSPRLSSWPEDTRHIGFLRSDKTESGDTPTELDRVLERKPESILITAGTSISSRARQFYDVAATACNIACFQGILVCPHSGLVASSLPPGVVRFDKLPFASVMPRVRLVIHHGGAGTMARSISAGVPQLILPFGADRPGNASQIEKLGLGAQVHPLDWEAPLVSRLLLRLVRSESVLRALADIRDRVFSRADLEAGCAIIDELGRRGTPRSILV